MGRKELDHPNDLLAFSDSSTPAGALKLRKDEAWRLAKLVFEQERRRDNQLENGMAVSS